MFSQDGAFRVSSGIFSFSWRARAVPDQHASW